ncbi:MAG: hypothetical protein A4E60_01705 [Syntrophorhabdus sp. PtaB.Bin047]|nr:MAG: hypothetical protein A4E60_01705 [Syntrophorhabdus sp. PtaB.Bin047]
MMIIKTKEAIMANDSGYPDIIIISGEGDNGTVEAYRGKDSPYAIKRRLTKERCEGDRWARAYRFDHHGDALSDDVGVYVEIDGEDYVTFHRRDIR